MVGMIFFQIYWVKRAVRLQEEQFNHRVAVAMNKVIDNLYENEDEKPEPYDATNLESAINLKIEGSINSRTLDSLIQAEFENQQISLDFEYGVLKCKDSKAVMCSREGFLKYLHKSKYKCKYAYYRKDCYNLSVYFPTLKKHLFQEAGMIISFPFLIILVFGLCFAYTINLLFRQKKLSDIKTDFINNMTHEFKTPISTISLASEVLKEEGVIGNPEKSTHYANIIHDENLRLKNQVEQVLQMAVIDRGKIKLNIKEVNVHELISSVTQSLQLQLKEKTGDLDLQLNARDSIIKADEFHVKNMIYNLLDNAIKYSETPVKIKLTTKNYDRGITISVEDSGCGISKADQKQIFERFYRVPTGDLHDVKGFGLGLNYVKAMVDAHHGDLRVTSELKKGSKFEIDLPYNNF